MKLVIASAASVVKAFALRSEWIFYTALSGVALLLGVFISKQVLSREHRVHKTGLEVQETSRLEELEKEKEKRREKGGDGSDATEASDSV